MFPASHPERHHPCVAHRAGIQSVNMAAAPSDAAPRGTETVLLVHPDAEARTLTAFMLGRLGYTVHEAHHGGEALRMFEECGGAVDLLLAEMRMPRMSGQELAQALTASNPGLRVLFLADSARRARGILARPFTSRILADRVRQILDRPAARPKTMTAGHPF